MSTPSRERQLIGNVWQYRTADEGGGGGSQTVERIEFPVAFDTPNFQAQDFPITAVDAGTKTFTIAGNHADLNVGYSFIVFGSSDNDAQWAVDSVTNVGGNTHVVTSGDGMGSTADGTLSLLTGVAVYTPAVGEEIIAAYVYTPATWDDGGGQQPRCDVGYTDDQSGLGSWDLWVPGAAYDSHIQKSGGGTNVFGSSSGGTQAYLFTDTTPVRAVAVDQTTGGAPGATQGTATVVLIIGHTS